MNVDRFPQDLLNADISLKSPKDTKLSFDVTMRPKNIVDKKETAELALSDGTFSVGF